MALKNAIKRRIVDTGSPTFWAIVIGVLLVQDHNGKHENLWWLVATLVVMSGLLDLATTRPVLALACCSAVELVNCAAGQAPTIAIGYVVVAAAFVFDRRISARAPRRGLLALGALIVVGSAPTVLHLRASPIFSGPAKHVDAVSTFILLAAAMFLRSEWDAVDVLFRGERERRVETETERDRAAADERARIARELHDVVAHQMSVVVTQAQGAAAIVNTDPTTARRALDKIATTARDGLVEMRRLVQVDRPSAPVVDVEQPQPGLSLDDYARLAEAAEAAGLTDVRFGLHVNDPDAELPPGVALSAYRLVQEAVTNAAKHSPGATFAVEAIAENGILRIDAVNGPAQRPPADIPGSGVGLIGMRERVEFFGGTLETGPTADGGWSVRATFPTLEAPPSTD